MEKRTEEGKRRHDLGKREWYAKVRLKKMEHEQNNGIELGYPGVRISDYWKEKILNREVQILIVDGKMTAYKKAPNGYWRNHSNNKVKYLHREKMRLYLGFTEQEMEGYEVHHIDGNPNNNDLENLKLLTKNEHHKLHDRRSETSKRHVCKRCGRTYYASVSDSVYYCNRCI